ncbi:MAG: class I SAM-dependent methyltransferase [Anaerolineae bacterium]
MSPPDSPDFEAIARYYDLIYAGQVDDLPLWLHLAGAVEGSLLEIGCGTGRVLLPLADAGHSITGLDLAETALAAARAKIEAAGLAGRASVVKADMRQFNLPRQDFALALLPTNTFMHCLATAEQLACLRAIRSHLRPGGQVAIDLFHPHPAHLLEADGRLHFEGDLVDEAAGRRAQWFTSQRAFIDRQVQEVTFLLDEVDQAGLVRRTALHFPLRYVHRYEMEHLLDRSGFAVEQIYGDYDRSPFAADSPRMIVLASKVALA